MLIGKTFMRWFAPLTGMGLLLGSAQVWADASASTYVSSSSSNSNITDNNVPSEAVDAYAPTSLSANVVHSTPSAKDPYAGTASKPSPSNTTSANSGSIYQRAHLFGDWGGIRPQLEKEGVVFNFSYVGEMAHNFAGGTDGKTRYADQWTAGVNVDLEKKFNWKGATFQWTYTMRDGNSLGTDADLKVLNSVQQIYGRGQAFRLSQLWINQKLFNDKMEVKLGRLGLGEDFASFACDFQNLTFCGPQPGVLVGDYWFNSPVSQWGGRFLFHVSKKTYAQFGVYQYNPTYAETYYGHHHGWQPDFPHGTKGTLIPVELGTNFKLWDQPSSLKVGGWYLDAKGNDLLLNTKGDYLAYGGSPLQTNSRYGAFTMFKQRLTGSDAQGLSGIINATIADHRTTLKNYSVITGVEYQAPFDRKNDFIGWAVGVTNANPRAGLYDNQYNELHPNNPINVNSQAEYETELFYSWAPIPSLSFRPNLQYILNPGGNSHNKDVFVFGLRLGATF